MSTFAGPKEVLDLLKIDYIERGNRLAFKCLFHHDINPSTGFYLDTGLCHCFSCGYTLGVIPFYARARRLSRERAEEELVAKFGGVFEPHVPDLLMEGRERAKAERYLLAKKGTLLKEQHAGLGETLDRILLAFHRGQIDKSKLDKALIVWYNRLEEGPHARSDGRPTPETDPADRVEEGLGHLLGSRLQGGRPVVETPWPETPDGLVQEFD